jgi:steroid 5-alpha reductase family enzyme
VSDFLAVSGASLLACVLLMAATAAWARSVRRAAVVDVVWGPGFVLVALVSALVGSLVAEPGWRVWLLLALVATWGGRLGWHIRRRAQGHGEDPRYAKLLGVDPEDDVRAWFSAAVRKVFLVQGFAMWFVSLPVQVAAVLEPAWWPLVVAGALLWLVGIVFESVGDAQLSAYKADPDRKPVMDRGLWRYTRHPNYFGDACVWWGLWLAGALASGWLPGLLTVLSPVAMTWFLVFATGAKLLEKSMMQRDGYPEYAARTSMFFPLPPKKR